jgi:DMSO/TMAO reductase YedYZ molybdopterin-dependent catalytic subunit
MANPIISSDTQRAERLPPGQKITHKWPVLHAGEVPPFDPATWDLFIFGLVKEQKSFTWKQFCALPRVQVQADMHCVTRWSKLDNLWEGVATRELLHHVEPLPEAKFVMVHCEYGFTTNLPLADFFSEDALFAMKHNGADLEPAHGHPLRLVIPKLYAWKSAKWVRAIEFTDLDRRGFWEVRGYHNHADPWREERYSAQEDGGD